MWCRLVSTKYIASTSLVGSCDRSFLHFSFIVYITIGTSGDVISPRTPFNPRNYFCVNPSSRGSATSRHPATAARTSSGNFCVASSVSANSQQRTRSTLALSSGPSSSESHTLDSLSLSGNGLMSKSCENIHHNPPETFLGIRTRLGSCSSISNRPSGHPGSSSPGQ